MSKSSEFVRGTERNRHVPQLEKVTGTVRFDIRDRRRTDHLFVSISNGDVEITEKMADADCVFGADKELMESVIRGETNVMAAVLRGAVTIEGDPELAVMVQRVFQGGSNGRHEKDGGRKRKSR